MSGLPSIPSRQTGVGVTSRGADTSPGPSPSDSAAAALAVELGVVNGSKLRIY